MNDEHIGLGSFTTAAATISKATAQVAAPVPPVRGTPIWVWALGGITVMSAAAMIYLPRWR